MWNLHRENICCSIQRMCYIFTSRSNVSCTPSGTWRTVLSRGIWEDSFLRALAHTRTLCAGRKQEHSVPHLCDSWGICGLSVIPCNTSPSNQWHSNYVKLANANGHGFIYCVHVCAPGVPSHVRKHMCFYEGVIVGRFESVRMKHCGSVCMWLAWCV